LAVWSSISRQFGATGETLSIQAFSGTPWAELVKEPTAMVALIRDHEGKVQGSTRRPGSRAGTRLPTS
jgi:hypothetical protein